MSQRPNVLRGGEAEGLPGRTRTWDTWLFSTSLPEARPRKWASNQGIFRICLPCAELFPTPGR